MYKGIINYKFGGILILLVLIFPVLLLGCGKPALSFSPASLPQAYVGKAYQVNINISQNSTPVGSLTVEKGNLPPGLTLQFNKGTDSGVITGTPTEAGSFKFTLNVWCMGTNSPGQTGSHDYTILVK
jgi:hypothetical protein